MRKIIRLSHLLLLFHLSVVANACDADLADKSSAATVATPDHPFAARLVQGLFHDGVVPFARPFSAEDLQFYNDIPYGGAGGREQLARAANFRLQRALPGNLERIELAVGQTLELVVHQLPRWQRGTARGLEGSGPSIEHPTLLLLSPYFPATEAALVADSEMVHFSSGGEMWDVSMRADGETVLVRASGGYLTACLGQGLRETVARLRAGNPALRQVQVLLESDYVYLFPEQGEPQVAYTLRSRLESGVIDHRSLGRFLRQFTFPNASGFVPIERLASARPAEWHYGFRYDSAVEVVVRVPVPN